jgi:hypothetical protein
LFQDEINAACQRRNAERMALIKSETAEKNSVERRKSLERRISPERRKSSEHRKSLERLPGERPEKRIRLREDLSGK